jgi:hypothetical protein
MSARSEKVTRLLESGRVELIGGDHLWQLTVVGDSGTPYRVVVGATLSGMCMCEGWRRTMKPCTHIEAARRLMGALPEQAQPWHDAAAARKASDVEKGRLLIESLLTD